MQAPGLAVRPCTCNGLLTQVDDPEVTADVLRAEPVGEDGRGARYYFLSGDKHEDCYLFK